MPRRLALLVLLGALCACNPSSRDKEVVQPAAPEQKKVVAPALTKQQLDERSERCAKMAGEQFRRAWKDGTEKTADERMVAVFTHHYNVRLNTCFYLLTVNRYANKDGPGGAPATTLNKMLFDVDGGELYGEYLGPPTSEAPVISFPKACIVESLYCASGREWDVLVKPYMEN